MPPFLKGISCCNVEMLMYARAAGGMKMYGLWIMPSMIRLYGKYLLGSTNNDWDFEGVPNKVGLWRGAKQGWALKGFQTRLGFKFYEFHVASGPFNTGCWSFWWGFFDLAKSKGLCDLQGFLYTNLIGSVVTFRYFERRVTLIFSFKSFYIINEPPKSFHM